MGDMTRSKRLSYLLGLFGLIALFSYVQLPSPDWTALSAHGPSSVDIKALLSNTPAGFEETDFTFIPGSRTKPPLVGSPVTFVELDDQEIIDVRTGRSFKYTEGTTFNLAVLKLPHGSAWDFVGVARGPTYNTDFMKIVGLHSREQTLVGMGLNLTSDGRLVAVTKGQIIDLPMLPNEACTGQGEWAATYGPEDPRLFWTDTGTPGFTFGRFATTGALCRNVGYVSDLRSIYSPLHHALKTGHLVRPFDGKIVPGEAHARNRELVRLHDQRYVEKNWVTFFPGARPNASVVYPHIHYAFSPDLSLEPHDVSLRQVVYSAIPGSSSPKVQKCIGRHHHGLGEGKLHQATPFYRLTMCKRGCLPTNDNTVYLTLGHLEQRPSYRKFFATYSVTAPFAPISVGPVVDIRGLQDEHHINYVLALQPVSGSDVVASGHSLRSDLTMPDHFFLDDLVLVTMGHRDDKMTSTIITMEDVLGGHKLCEDI